MTWWGCVAFIYFYRGWLDLLALFSRKKLPVSSVRVQKFCATTQFDASKVHDVFKSPYTLKEGLDKTLEHEFINKKDDGILFFTE